MKLFSHKSVEWVLIPTITIHHSKTYKCTWVNFKILCLVIGITIKPSEELKEIVKQANEGKGVGLPFSR